MMYPKYRSPNQSRFQFALENVGKFTPPKRSMFNEEAEGEPGAEDEEGTTNQTTKETISPTKQTTQSPIKKGKKTDLNEESVIITGIACEVNELQKQQQLEEQEKLLQQQRNEKFLSQYGIKIIEKDNENLSNQIQIRTTTVKSGRIQFTDIIIPPDAPKDLICEECETRYSSYYCSACRQIFCYQCADLCHPRVSANTIIHEHEANGFIRAIQYGDKSKVKVINDFYLPDHEVYPEEFSRVKDLTKPNTLMTNPTSIKKFVLQPSRQLPANKPLFHVNELVIFTDPVTSQKAYGRIISEYDELHGNVSTPAIIRGEDSNRYYTVQLIDLLSNSDDIASILLQDEHYLEEEKHKKRKKRQQETKEIETQYHLIPELPYDPMKTIRDKILILNQSIQDLRNRLLLGPQYHLRNLTFPKGVPFNMDPIIEEKGEGKDVAGSGGDQHSTESSVSSVSHPANPSQQQQILKSSNDNKKGSVKPQPNIQKLIHKLNQEENSDEEMSEESSLHNPNVPKHFQRHSLSKLSLQQQISLYHIKKQHQQLRPIQEGGARGGGGGGGANEKGSPTIQSTPNKPPAVSKKEKKTKSSDAMSDITMQEKDHQYLPYAERDDPDYYHYQQRHHHSTFAQNSLIKSNLHRRQRQYQKDLITILDPPLSTTFHPQDYQPNHRIDYNQYANIDTLDDESVLSYYNQHQLAIPAIHRTYEDYIIQSTVDAYKTSHYYPNQPPPSSSLSHDDDNDRQQQQQFRNQKIEQEIQSKLLNILLLPEKEIEMTFIKYLEELNNKKNSLLKGVFTKTELIYLKAMVFMKFQHWKRFNQSFTKHKVMKAIIKIQTRIRVWLCRNVLHELRLYYHNIEMEKHRLLHQKFRYCSSTDPYSITIDGKLFFQTHADVNRYIYFIRVMILKIIKYLTIKKLHIYSKVFQVWKSAIYEFKEGDLTNQHIQMELVKIDAILAGPMANLPIEELKQQFLNEHDQLLYQLLTNPESNATDYRMKRRKLLTEHEKRVREGGEERERDDSYSLSEEDSSTNNSTITLSRPVIIDPNAYENYQSIPLNPIPEGPPIISPEMAKVLGVEGNTVPSSKSAAGSEHSSEWGVLATPTIQFIKNYSEFKRKFLTKNQNQINEKQLLNEKQLEKQQQQRTIIHRPQQDDKNPSPTDDKTNEEENGPKETSILPLPNYNPSMNLPLPILPIFTRPKNFKDRLYYDIIQQPAMNSTVDYYNPMLVNHYHHEYRLYKTQLEGPTSESYWLIPNILMLGNIPFGPAIKKRFDIIPTNYHDTVKKTEAAAAATPTAMTSPITGTERKETSRPSSPTLLKKTKPSSPSRLKTNANEVTAISALLLAGVDTFVSILSEEEEKILQIFYQSPHTIEELIHQALEQTKILSKRIIGDHLVLITKQEQQLLLIPTFGKSDPRYAQAYQEKLRCQGRITFYKNTINTIRNQIKLLPAKLYFYRLLNNTIPSNAVTGQYHHPTKSAPQADDNPTDLPSCMPWTISQLLPSIWFLEKLIRDSHTIYLYSGSYFYQKEDGPTKDGLAGTIGSILLGRLYHLKGIDAIYQWQKSHDFMKILQLYEQKDTMTNPFLPEKLKIDQTKKKKNINRIERAVAEEEDSDLQEGDHSAMDTMTSNKTGKLLFQEELQKFQETKLWKSKPLHPSAVRKEKKLDEAEEEEESKLPVVPISQNSSGLEKQQQEEEEREKNENPTIEVLQKHGRNYLYRTSCPPLQWQKSLIQDMLEYSHEWINYPIIRSQITPEIYTILERNHYDITLRNQNLSSQQLTDYYTSQEYLPTSMNNLPFYSNFTTDEKKKKNLLRHTTIAAGVSGVSGSSNRLSSFQGDVNSLSSKNVSISSNKNNNSFTNNNNSSSFSVSGKGSGLSQKGIGHNPTGIIIRGDAIKEEEEDEENEEHDGGAAITSPPPLRSQPTLDSLSLSSKSNPTIIMKPKATSRMTILQKMQKQVEDEEKAELLKKQKEKEDKESFNSKEFNEAERQEMIMSQFAVQRLQQSLYEQSLPPQLQSNIPLTARSMKSVTSRSSKSSR